MSDIFKKLLILRTNGIGAVKYNDLISRFESTDAILNSLDISQSHRDNVLREMDMAQKIGAVYLTPNDSFYPKNLLNAKNHPPIICALGNINTLQKPAIGIVGTRNASVVGLRFVSELAMNIADNNTAVISGMAMGTDTAAHNGALLANGDSNTVAVLAGGVDYIWPLENQGLYNKIKERGCIISEMPIGFVPRSTNFVPRNKIIAEISDKLIIAEADLKSGSMTTADFAIRAERPIFAIPGHPSDSRNFGPNRLIKSGAATLIEGINDFILQKNKNCQDMGKKSDKNDDILTMLGPSPVPDSVLAEMMNKSIGEIKSRLVVLELQGFVKKIPNGYVKL